MRNNNKIYLKGQNILYVCGIFVFLKITDYKIIFKIEIIFVTDNYIFIEVYLAYINRKKCRGSDTQQHLLL